MTALKAFSQRTVSRSQRERRELAISCESATRNFKASSGGAGLRPSEPTSAWVRFTGSKRPRTLGAGAQSVRLIWAIWRRVTAPSR